MLPFYIFSGSEAFNSASLRWVESMTSAERNHMNLTLPPPVRTDVTSVTISNLVQRFNPVKYLKIDVEGFEFQAISTLSVPIPLISLEFNLPQFWESLGACVRLIEEIDGGYRFNAAITEPPV
jgi:hypothetical protein